MDPDRKNTIVFFHPDLGIGGAERLVVDAAVGLQELGHPVVIYTNHCDPKHCFDECRDGTLDVRVYGNTIIPRSIFSRLVILCAILRHFHLLLKIWRSGELYSLEPAAVFVDQLSAGLPLMRIILPGTCHILFYCHFPDLLLVQGRKESVFKRLYRIPFDRIEEKSMSYADDVAVNSNFTKNIVAKTWPELQQHVTTQVVYPCVKTPAPEPTNQNDDDNDTDDTDDTDTDADAVPAPAAPAAPARPPFLADSDPVILSINRFERKKDIGLAIKAFAAIPTIARKNVRLVAAGGYDPRVTENVQYHKELQALADSLGLSHETISPTDEKDTPTTAEVLFLLSVPGDLKESLLAAARLLVYTPSNEHFGIVPLEAMLANVPVLAANTGGPVETVVDNETGWLREPDDSYAWSRVIRMALNLSPEQKLAFGKAGAKRVNEIFSRDQMALHLDDIIKKGIHRRKTQYHGEELFSLFMITLAVIIVLLVWLYGILVDIVWWLIWG